jgi:hypothetical protein
MADQDDAHEPSNAGAECPLAPADQPSSSTEHPPVVTPGPSGASKSAVPSSNRLTASGSAGCAVAGCDRPRAARGWCRPHYVRWQRHGDPRAGTPIAVRGGQSRRVVLARVRRERGPASEQVCASCGAAAWCWTATDPQEQYPKRFLPSCRSCLRRTVPGASIGSDEATREQVGSDGLAPAQFGSVYLWSVPQLGEPFIPPPKSMAAFILGNKYVWRRFMSSMVVLAIAVLVVAITLKVLGVQLDGLLTVAMTSAATALGFAGREYLRKRKSNSASDSDTSSDGDSSTT